MLLHTIASVLLSTSNNLATARPTKHDQSSVDGVGPLFPDKTNITYYHGPGCHMEQIDLKDVLKAEYSTAICHESILVEAVPNNNCTFTVYMGSITCSGRGEQVRYVIPAESGSLCVDASALDEWRSEKASGVWSCG